MKILLFISLLLMQIRASTIHQFVPAMNGIPGAMTLGKIEIESPSNNNPQPSPVNNVDSMPTHTMTPNEIGKATKDKSLTKNIAKGGVILGFVGIAQSAAAYLAGYLPKIVKNKFVVSTASITQVVTATAVGNRQSLTGQMQGSTITTGPVKRNSMVTSFLI